MNTITTTQQSNQTLLLPTSQMPLNPMESIGERFRLANEIASAMQYATLIPDHLRGERRKVGNDWELVPFDQKQIHANVMLVVNRALQWGVDPMALIGSSYVVAGKLDFEGKVFIAVVNALAGLRENLSFAFEGEGENLSVTVTGRFASEQPDESRSITVEWASAVTRDKNGKVTEQWTKDPKQKLAYTAAKRWARLHAPGVTLGLFSEDDESHNMTGITATARPVTQSKRLPEPSRSAKIGWLDRISECDTRAELQRLVDRIKAEVPAALPTSDRDDLVAICKDRWREIGDDAGEEVGQ